jgi:hypothetical protein
MGHQMTCPAVARVDNLVDNPRTDCESDCQSVQPGGGIFGETLGF